MSEYQHDKYDDAYDAGYRAGRADLDPSYPEDDTAINYDDGYRDGALKREDDLQDAAVAS